MAGKPKIWHPTEKGCSTMLSGGDSCMVYPIFTDEAIDWLETEIKEVGYVGE